MIADSFIQELKTYCDVESVISSYVKLSRKGKNLVGLCPFHSEKSPSFFVYPQTQSFYCFGCGAGGDIITFLKKIENIEYIEAVKLLAQRAGVPLPEEAADDNRARMKARVLEINRETARFYHQCLVSPQGAEAYHYLIQRGRTPKIIRRFGLGYSPNNWDTVMNHLRGKGFQDHELEASGIGVRAKSGSLYDRFRGRVIFPIIDLRGNVVGFGGRALEDRGPKYLNSGDTMVFKKSKNLFALNFAKATKSEQLILAEGYMDVIAIHQAGVNNAVATLGTSLTEEQARLISQYTDTVVIAYDSDGAGQAATKRAINIFSEVGVKVNILSIPGAKDPDEFLQKYGPQRFQMLLEGCANALEFEIGKIKAKYNTQTPDGKVSYLKEFAKLMAGIHNPLEREVYISEAAQSLGVAAEAINAQVGAILKKEQRSANKKEQNDTNIYIGDMAAGRGDLQRKKYLKYAIAEERIIGVLLKNPDYLPVLLERIRPEEFVTDVNREIITLITGRIQAGRPAEPMALSESLSPEGMARVSGILANAPAARSTREELEDYINILQEFYKTKTEKDVAQMDSSQLREYIQSLKDKKK